MSPKEYTKRFFEKIVKGEVEPLNTHYVSDRSCINGHNMDGKSIRYIKDNKCFFCVRVSDYKRKNNSNKSNIKKALDVHQENEMKKLNKEDDFENLFRDT